MCPFRSSLLTIKLNTPPAHPLKPLTALRASIALENTGEVVNTIFEFIWAKGQLPDGAEWVQCLLDQGLNRDMLSNVEVKAKLRKKTESAINAGMFGVPTFIIDEELFFGQYEFNMLLSCLQDESVINSSEYQSLGNLPISVERQ